MAQQNPKGGEVQTETGEMLKGPKPREQQQSSQPNAKQKSGQHKNEGQQQGGQGDERTPDKPIGQVAYAEGRKKQDEGDRKPHASNLEPEKQGGIGGP